MALIIWEYNPFEHLNALLKVTRIVPALCELVIINYYEF